MAINAPAATAMSRNPNNVNSLPSLTATVLKNVLLVLCAVLFFGYFVMSLETFVAFARVVATVLYISIAWKLVLLKLPWLPDVASIYAGVDSRDSPLLFSDVLSLCIYGSFAVFTLVRTTKQYSMEVIVGNDWSLYSHVALFLCQSLGGILLLGLLHFALVPARIRAVLGHVYITIISVIFSFSVLSAWVTLDEQAPTGVLVFYNCVTVGYVAIAHLLSLVSHFWPYIVVFMFNTMVITPVSVVTSFKSYMFRNADFDEVDVEQSTAARFRRWRPTCFINWICIYRCISRTANHIVNYGSPCCLIRNMRITCCQLPPTQTSCRGLLCLHSFKRCTCFSDRISRYIFGLRFYRRNR